LISYKTGRSRGDKIECARRVEENLWAQ
jgi:hypothetical protein